ncbi:MAG: cupin domain-containing protein [bacterium]
MDAINLAEKFKLFDETWHPKVIAQLNNYQVKLVKLEGEFVWHDHADTDELFFCVDGEFHIDFRHGSTHIKAGELCVVPKGVEHRPRAQTLCHVLIFETDGVVNTGNIDSDLQAPVDEWL